MNRIKIVQEGWAGFTGNFGQIDFVDGVSATLVPQIFADRIACSLNVVDADTDEPVGIAQRMVTNKTVVMEIATLPETPVEDEAPVTPPVETPREMKLYTAEDLETVADESGIAGLRVIGNTFGVKGRAIPELIADILKAQAAIKARLDAANAPAESETPAEEA